MVDTTVTLQATALQGVHQRAEVAVAREQDYMVDIGGELEGIDGELDVHVPLHLAAAMELMNSLVGLVTTR